LNIQFGIFSELIDRSVLVYLEKQRPPSEIDFMRKKTKPDIVTVKAEQSDIGKKDYKRIGHL